MSASSSGQAAAARTWDPGDLRPPTASEFQLFATLVEREAGIFLSPAKVALLTSRLVHRVRELGLTTFGAYYRHVASDSGGEEIVRLIDAICTNETHFFREPHHFELIANRLLPRWVSQAREGRRERRLRLWSAGCSSGEEPYSLAMLLLDRLPAGEDWQIEIVATDLSTKVLARAQAAIYPMARLHEVPLSYRKRFLLRGVGDHDGRFKVGPVGRAPVRFERLNLTATRYAMPEHLDIVMCRNVLIYFKPETRARVVAQLCRHLAGDGHLFLGHAESLQPSGLPLRTVIPTVYQVVSDRAGGTP